MNRAAAREARRAARRNGCTCHPTITKIAGNLPSGVTAGAMVQHHPGCVLGDQVKKLNRQGLMPALFSHGTDCSR